MHFLVCPSTSISSQKPQPKNKDHKPNSNQNTNLIDEKCHPICCAPTNIQCGIKYNILLIEVWEDIRG